MILYVMGCDWNVLGGGETGEESSLSEQLLTTMMVNEQLNAAQPMLERIPVRAVKPAILKSALKTTWLPELPKGNIMD